MPAAIFLTLTALLCLLGAVAYVAFQNAGLHIGYADDSQAYLRREQTITAQTVDWKGVMTPVDRDSRFHYQLSPTVQRRLEADWQEIVANIVLVPRWLWTPARLDQYTTNNPLMQYTPSAAMETVLHFDRRETLSVFCDETGIVCQVTDLWSDLSQTVYDDQNRQVLQTSVFDCEKVRTVAVLAWFANRWKLEASPVSLCVVPSSG